MTVEQITEEIQAIEARNWITTLRSNKKLSEKLSKQRLI